MAEYVKNQIFHSPLTGSFFFVPRAKVLDGGMLQVVGKKVDVTESIERLFPKTKKRAARPRKPVKR